MINATRSLLKFLFILPALLVMGTAAADSHLEKSGIVKFESTSIGIAIGVEWGTGTLEFQGQTYSFKVKGLGLASAGVSKVSAEGEVYGLKDVADFPGNYGVAGMGLTIAGGGDDLVVKNGKGVHMVLQTANKGLQLNLGGGGLKIEMVE